MSNPLPRRRFCLRVWWPLLLPIAAVVALPMGAGPVAARGAAPVTQSAASIDQILARLDGSDAIARRDARTELARRGKSALPRLLKALSDPRSSARMRVGLIGSLNDMAGVSDDDVSGAPFAMILRSVGDPDPALSAEAYRYFAKYIVAGSADAVSPSRAGLEVQVQGARPKQDGNFKFIFSTSGTTAVRLTLTEIQCFEDSSSGTTRWLFTVLAEGRSFAVPEQRYGDAGNPERYPMSALGRSSVEQRPQQYGIDRQASDRFSLSVPAGRLNSPLRIVGYKPKHLQ